MKRQFVTIIMILLLTQIALSVSVAPEIIQQLKDSGKLEEFVEQNKTARDKGVWEANPEPYRFGVASDVDTLYCIILLVDFDDMQHESGYDASPDDFDSLLFSREVFEPGSMTDYYFETSYGQALLLGQVTQWYRMPQTYAYYVDGQRGFGDYPRNAQRLTEDAVLMADPDVDFSLYDNNDDYMVDGLFVVHAGPGYEDTGNPNYIHSHAWVTSYQVWLDDDVYVWRYSMEPEETGNNQLVHIGVFCHEFGHVLGMPDLYDYDYDSDGTGMWSLMSGGSWGGGGARPVHFDAWCKVALGWVAPTVLTDNIDQEQIDAVEYNPDIYLLYSHGWESNQYFLVENRRLRLFDLSLPGEGLLIYHVDDLIDNNDDQTHYHVAVEQADGEFDLENNNGSDPGDPWPGTSDNRTFDDFSTPNAWFYYIGPSEIAVANISNSDSVMYADLFIEYNAPLYEILNVNYVDDGNENGVPEVGETCDYIFTAENIRSDADNLVVTISCSNPEIVFSDSISTFGSIPADEPFDNSADPMTFSIPDDFEDSFVEFTLIFSSNDGESQQEFNYQVLIGTPDVFLVDDDDSDVLESYYISAFDSLGLLYVVWDINTQGSPSDELNGYNLVLWFTGDSRTEPISASDVSGLISYLDGGGHLLVTSQDFVQNLSQRAEPNDLTLLNDYLKVDYVAREQNHTINGEAGSYFDGLTFLTIGNGGAYNQNSQDALELQDGGIQVLTYNPGTIAGVGVLNNYTSLTLGFGIEGINNNLNDYNTREDIIEASVMFLQSTTDVDEYSISLPQRFNLSQNYPNPFNAGTTISYTLSQPSDVVLEVYDLLGRCVETLVGQKQPAGSHQVTWDADDYSSGIYFYKLNAGEMTSAKKMVLLK